MIDENGRECMTVGELVLHLQQFDPNLPVLYQAMSDYSELHPEEVKVITASDRIVCYRKQNGYMMYNSYCHKGEEPVFRSALVLPGN